MYIHIYMAVGFPPVEAHVVRHQHQRLSTGLVQGICSTEVVHGLTLIQAKMLRTTSNHFKTSSLFTGLQVKKSLKDMALLIFFSRCCALARWRKRSCFRISLSGTLPCFPPGIWPKTSAMSRHMEPETSRKYSSTCHCWSDSYLFILYHSLITLSFFAFSSLIGHVTANVPKVQKSHPPTNTSYRRWDHHPRNEIAADSDNAFPRCFGNNSGIGKKRDTISKQINAMHHCQKARLWSQKKTWKSCCTRDQPTLSTAETWPGQLLAQHHQSLGPLLLTHHTKSRSVWVGFKNPTALYFATLP